MSSKVYDGSKGVAQVTHPRRKEQNSAGAETMTATENIIMILLNGFFIGLHDAGVDSPHSKASAWA